MRLDLQITPLAEPALIQAAAIQGRAFHDDPAFAFTFPDEKRRQARLPWLMRVGIACGLKFGHVTTTTGPMFGHAVWFPPGETSLTPQRTDEAGFAEAASKLDDSELARFSDFMDVMSAHHDRLVPTPHWYLMILGVDPPFKGQGIGGDLIAPTLARADADALPCYLETANPRNLSFYRRHGFEVRHVAAIPGGGPTVWMMVREAR